MLRLLDLQEVHRELHACFEEAMVVPRGEMGEQTEAILDQALLTLEQQGRLQQLYRNIRLPFQDWQTYEAPSD